MAYHIKGTAIHLTRGDTLFADVTVLNTDGTPYDFKDGDTVRFAMKETYEDQRPLISKELTIRGVGVARLRLDSSDTKDLNFGKYIYDVQITTHDDDDESEIVDTIIPRSYFYLEKEVD